MKYLKSILSRIPVLASLVLIGCGGGGGGSVEENPGVIAQPVLNLMHKDLVFDRTRLVYYASVASTDAARGNRIAVVDRNGTILSTSAPVGSNPTALAVSSDGSRLYVGLDGSGEVAQYALPDFTLLGKVTLPSDSFTGQMVAEQISVSPVDPNTIAVSLAVYGISPRHKGVAIIRNMTLLPARTQEHTGSNRIGFGPSGDEVYGFNNETTEFGVRRLVVNSVGVAQAAVVTVTNASFDSDIDVSQNLVLVGNRAYSPGSLAARGVIDGASYHCVPVSNATKVACFSTSLGSIVVANASNFGRLGELTFPETADAQAFRLVAGPSGQVAASSVSGGRIYFIAGELLR